MTSGRSSMSAMRRVKRAASAPSMTRWSYDSDSGSNNRGTTWPSRTTGCSRPRARPRVATPRIVDDRGKGRAADAAEVGDGERAAAQLLQRDLLLPRPLGDFGQLLG